ALVRRLVEQGNRVTALVRDSARSRSSLPHAVQLLSFDCDQARLARQIARTDTVINLAGAPILPRRWTKSRKRELADSRLAVTQRLVDALRTAFPCPSCLISASAAGYYGTAPTGLVDETSPNGTDFAAVLCRRWEQAALAARETGIRVVLLRLGVVLHPSGGMLGRALPWFRHGLGARIGAGNQPLPWISLTDVSRVIDLARRDQRFTGPFNLVSPEKLTQAQFCQCLARHLGRACRLRVPEFLARLGLGEAAHVLLGGQRAVPARLQQLGFAFQHATLRQALAEWYSDSQDLTDGRTANRGNKRNSPA
ncbi:MAG: TIGR01777 family oxidoreductase, partial [Myxococcota bacterium]